MCGAVLPRIAPNSSCLRGLQKPQSLAPHQLTQIAAGQQGKRPRSDAGAQVQRDHGFPVYRDIALVQRRKTGPQTQQRDRNQQMDGRVAFDIGQFVIADKYTADTGAQHKGDKPVARRAVHAGRSTSPLRAQIATGPSATAPKAALMWTAMRGDICMEQLLPSNGAGVQ